MLLLFILFKFINCALIYLCFIEIVSNYNGMYGCTIRLYFSKVNEILKKNGII